MKKNTPISLNDFEQRLARTVGRGRSSVADKYKLKACTVGKEGTQELGHIEGFAAELAFCKLFNIYPDLKPEPKKPKTDTGDCIWNGLVIDVKTTVYPEGKLLCVKWKHQHLIDYYALMTGVFPHYYYRGVMSAKELHRPERLRDFGHRSPAYSADQEELTDLI